MFVFGTRPEAIKMAPVIQTAKASDRGLRATVCVTAQHREMLDQVLKLFDVVPDYDLRIMTRDQSLPDLTAKVILKVTRVLEQEKPAMVFVQGDTTTTFAASLAAYYLKIPVAHIEAGLRTEDKHSPFPEEANRRLTSALADYHFAPTKGAKDNLLREGVGEASIYVTGNTVIDALIWMSNKQREVSADGKWRSFFESEYGIALSSRTKTILVTCHRRESFGEDLRNICNALSEIAETNSDVQIVYPVHLNPNVKKPVYSLLRDRPNVHLVPPLDYGPFVFLMSNSYLVLTDSGGIQEEAPSLGKPVLVMRDTTERPEAIESGCANLIGANQEDLVAETYRLLSDCELYRSMAKSANPFGDGKASSRVLQIVTEILDEKHRTRHAPNIVRKPLQ